ncbi:MAG: protein prkA, partial [Desulfitobacteriaceae bacterium]
MEVIQWLRDYQESEAGLTWGGTFREYLELVTQKPHLAMHSHARIYEMILAAGVKTNNGHKKYDFFSDELFGLDKPLEKLVEEYFHSSAMRLDVRKRILLLMGPVSGGKSTIVSLLKRGLEKFCKTEQGAVYAIEGCPMHEDPLHLLPIALRPRFEEQYNIKIEGSLCPVCRMRLEQEFAGDAEKFPIKRILFSEEERVGIGTFTPSDPKSQDIADLTGSIDFSTITEYGSESDPRAYRFDGELNKANRGLMEFQEMLKCDEKFLWNLLSLSQEGNFKAGRFALISADELVVAHTNESEYKAFIANKKNEALQSRIIVLAVPYNLRVSDEVKIY